LHPGAAAYVDGEEKTFLDRLQRFHLVGADGSVRMGSAGPWFAGYLKKDSAATTARLRERLLDMLGAARRSDSIEELDQMQTRLTVILPRYAALLEHGAIGKGR